MKKVLGVYGNSDRHWVGDGFPVRSLFSHATLGDRVSPFLLLDYAGPHFFEPSPAPRGVGEHPHRGFETVTIVYDGEIVHRDSTGQGGTIGPGDVQWMTAAGGILHEEFHSPGFTRSGGPFRMVQLWVNLPRADKNAPPGYQSIPSSEIPGVRLPSGAGKVRVIAGEYAGVSGPARTFTPINVWDMRLGAEKSARLELPVGHTAMVVVLSGHLSIGGHAAGEAEALLLDRVGSEVAIEANGDSLALVLTGEPIEEPVVSHGPFVMSTEAEVRQAMDDFNHGRFGAMERHEAPDSSR